MHTPPTTLLQVAGGGVGLMVGEKEFSPPREIAFSVSDTVGGVDDGVVADGVLVVGGTSSVLLQPAVSEPIITRAAALPASANRLVARTLIMIPHLSPKADPPIGGSALVQRSTADPRVAVKPSRLWEPSQKAARARGHTPNSISISARAKYSRNPAATTHSSGLISRPRPAAVRTITQLMKPTPIPLAIE